MHLSLSVRSQTTADMQNTNKQQLAILFRLLLRPQRHYCGAASPIVSKVCVGGKHTQDLLDASRLGSDQTGLTLNLIYVRVRACVYICLYIAPSHIHTHTPGISMCVREREVCFPLRRATHLWARVTRWEAADKRPGRQSCLQRCEPIFLF